MSKLINLEIVTIEDSYVTLETEDGFQFEVKAEMLPENLKEGRFLRFVISHTEYNLNDEYEDNDEWKEKDYIPNGRQLTW